jgi:hypothetical protein
MRTGAVIAVALTLVSAAGCGLTGPNRNEVGAAVVSWTYTAQPGDVLDLRDVAPFDWDHVAILDSYATNSGAREVLGFDWNVEDSPIAFTDGGSLVGFVLDGRIVAWTVVPASVPYQIAVTGDGLLMQRDNALFVWTGNHFELPG